MKITLGRTFMARLLHLILGFEQARLLFALAENNIFRAYGYWGTVGVTHKWASRLVGKGFFFLNRLLAGVFEVLLSVFAMGIQPGLIGICESVIWRM